MADRFYQPLKEHIEKLWPKGLLDPPSLDGMDDIWTEQIKVTVLPTVQMRAALLFKQDLPVNIPGIEGTSFVFLATKDDDAFMFEVDTVPSPVMRFVKASLALRFSKELLRPAKLISGDGDTDKIEADPAVEQVQVTLNNFTLSIDFNGSFELKAKTEFNLPLCLIGETGVAIEAEKLQFFGSHETPPPGKPAGWRGLFVPHAKLYLPAALSGLVGNLEVTDAYIGNGGFSGSVATSFTPAREGQLFGLGFKVEHVSLKFVQNTLAESVVKGTLKLPFFDEDIGVELGLDMDGGLTIKLASESGLLALEKPGILHLSLESLGFEVSGGVMTVMLSGQLRPLVGGLDWPEVRVRELSIDSEGHVHLEGGWLDLPAQYALDFHGFQLEIARLGFGKTEDGGKWIGFSGGLKLVEGLPAGASVEGLRVIWYEDGRAPAITLNGIGVEFEVPGVLRFKGDVAYRKLSESDHRFDGDIMLELTTLGQLKLDGKLVIGSREGSTYFAIYLGVELPAGIPLWTTGLALYGMAGLYALRMVPGKLPGEQWYENTDGSPGWYKRPDEGVTDLTKWENDADGMAFGVGVTIGTLADNGYTFNGKMMLVISFPGPILLLEGRASLLFMRVPLLGAEPPFRALAVLDNVNETALLTLDASYRYGDGGELIDIAGSAEAFFSGPDSWHVYLGQKEPREKRVHAHVFSLFDADSYFMLDSHRLEIGESTGWGNSWRFGPLRVALQAWIEGSAIISWNPVHFRGSLSAHGEASLRVFGHGISLGINAGITADVFTPFHLVGAFSVGIGLPWPLPDFDVGITLEWGPDQATPTLPQPLQEIAVKHTKVNVTWPLPLSDENASLENLPVVPLDCRPQITFARNVNDDALVGNNPQKVEPEYEQIGDPEHQQGPLKARYGLREVALHKRMDHLWKTVALKRAGQESKQLYGCWEPAPTLPDSGVPGQTKLSLWTKTPFDYTLHTSGAWDEWFTKKFPHYPCVPVPPDTEICYDFDTTPLQVLKASSWTHPEHPKLQLYWKAGRAYVTPLLEPVKGHKHGLMMLASEEGVGPKKMYVLAVISLPNPAKSVHITGTFLTSVVGYSVNTKNEESEPFIHIIPQSTGTIAVGTKLITLDVSGEDMKYIVLVSYFIIGLIDICVVSGLTAAETKEREEMNKHLQDQMALWSQAGEVLEPHSTYRLKVVTTVQRAQDAPDPAGLQELVNYAYFRTEGPPGLAELSAPAGSAAEFDSGLSDLSRYVRQTVPATVPREGEKPPLPRPVYRAYDVGVEFNEDYVDLMYRLGRRDLGLYLYSNNNEPVRDAEGRLLVLGNRWGQTDQVTVKKSEQKWISVINSSTCASLDTNLLLPDKTLSSSDQVLEPDCYYEARLIPLLLHEDFGSYLVGERAHGPASTLEIWRVSDGGDHETPSHWEVAKDSESDSRFITQKSNIWGEVGGDDKHPGKPGTMLLRDDDPLLPPEHGEQPGNWTDYRLSLYMRSTDDDAMGVVFRHRDDSNFYRFSMDRERKYRRLVRALGGAYTVLAQDDFVYHPNSDYLITIEAVGSRLRVYQDGALVFDVDDAALSSGRVGLYCWANEGVRFSDVRVDDFRRVAPVVYRFNFTTSRFANFFHQLHSFQDETWLAQLPPEQISDNDLALLLSRGVEADTAPSDDEARAFEKFAGHVLGSAASQNPPAVEVTRVERSGAAIAFLVRSPEPLVPLSNTGTQEWRRTELELRFAGSAAVLPTVPGQVKLTGVTFGANHPNEESVELLIREATDLTGYEIQYRHIPQRAGIVADAGVHLTELQRVSAIWTPYYTFKAEKRLPAGTRVRVHSGNETESPEAEPGVVQRFAATPNESGEIRLPEKGVDLRLIPPRQSSEHTRRFLHDGEFAGVDARLLRQADGTGFVLFLSAGAELATGQYRLKMTYRRDITDIEPNSQVFKQAGRSEAEQVSIDIPWQTRG